MQVDIINRSNLALSYIRESLAKWGDSPRFKDAIDTFKQCELIAMQNHNMVLRIYDLDIELKMQQVVNHCITYDTGLNTWDRIKFDYELKQRGAHLEKLLKDVKDEM